MSKKPTSPAPEQALTDAQRSIVLHSLGVEYPRGKRKPKPYRNHYCTNDGDPALEEIVSLGLMDRGGTINKGADRYYHVTEQGAAAVGHRLPD